MKNQGAPVWAAGLHFKSYIVAEDGILVAILFTLSKMIALYLSIVSVLVVIAWIGSIRVPNDAQDLPSAVAAIILMTSLLLYPLSYTISMAKRRGLSGKGIEALLALKSVNLVKWSEVRKVEQVGGAFYIWTSRDKLVFRVKHARVHSIETFLHENTEITWVPMRRRWKALLGAMALIAFGFISAFVPSISLKFQLPNGSNLIVYPFIMAGYLALVLSIVFLIYFAVKLEVATDNPSSLV